MGIFLAEQAYKMARISLAIKTSRLPLGVIETIFEQLQESAESGNFFDSFILAAKLEWISEDAVKSMSDRIIALFKELDYEFVLESTSVFELVAIYDFKISWQNAKDTDDGK